ncbi:MAG TPA: Fic family protein [Thermoanaerobaculia bacterium]|jgi:Fic family protein|nr:Fic family protein [Thermoanaerobaculia bacterium]
MDQSQFIAHDTGRLVKTLDGHVAFVPAPLPPKIDLSFELMRRLSEADHALGTLGGIGRILPNPHLLTQPFLNREAVLSSRIEGTEASATDLALFQAAGSPESNESDVREVSNYVTALRYGLKRLDELPLSLRFLREVHEKLMTDVRGGGRNPGQFRHVQNWIGPAGSRIDNATYVPPPVQEMHAALDQFERYLHDRSPMPVLLRAAMVHYHFEAIHPFLDGNGRVGRLLIAFMLQVENVLDQPLLYLSAYFERHRREYYRSLVEVTMKGAWLEWIDFFLRGVTEQANDAVRRTRELLDLSENYRRKIAPARNAGVLSSLIDSLFASPATTIPSVAANFKMSYPAAKKNVQKLVALHILKPRRAGRGSVYVAEDVLKIVEAP